MNKKLITLLILSISIHSMTLYSQQNEWEDTVRYEWNKEKPPGLTKKMQQSNDIIPRKEVILHVDLKQRSLGGEHLGTISLQAISSSR